MNSNAPIGSDYDSDNPINEETKICPTCWETIYYDRITNLWLHWETGEEECDCSSEGPLDDPEAFDLFEVCKCFKPETL